MSNDVPVGLMIRRAVAADASSLAAFAARTFRDTYAADNHPDDVEHYIAASFAAQFQRAEIDDPSSRTLLMEIASELIAYSQLRHSAPPACVNDPSAVEISRFYIDRSWFGRGIAQRLMAATWAEAQVFDPRTLWLGVWERNARAIAFYRKCGFAHIGMHDFIFGRETQKDLVMALPLSRSAG